MRLKHTGHQLIFITAIALFGPAVSYNSTGEDSCPCVSVSHNSSVTFGGTTYEYGTDYGGYTCLAHDEGLKPWCTSSTYSDNADFCDALWCYVDGDKCHDSEYSFARSTIFPDLHYSYDTCGSISSNRNFNIRSSLEGTVIRAAISYMSYPDHYKVAADGTIIEGPTTNDTSGYVGLYIDLIQDTASRAGFTIEWTYVSQSSRNKHHSAWDACVDDVSKRLVDLCVGNYWTTKERLANVAFTTSYDIEKWYMMVPRTSEEINIWTNLYKPFEPFTFDAWLCIIGIIIFTAFIKVVVHRHYEADKTKFGPARFLRVEMYESILEFFSGAVDYQSSPRVPLMIISLGYAVFIIVTISCYTGNLTAILTTDNIQITGFTSLQDCIDVSCIVCANEFSAAKLIDTYGNSININTPVRGTGSDINDVINAVIDGECDVAIENDYSFKVSKLDGIDEICEQRFVGTDLIWIPVAQPVNPDIAESLNYYLREIVTDGTYRRVYEHYISDYTSTCDPFLLSYDQGISDDTDSMDYTSLLSPILISLVCSVIAVSISLCQNRHINFTYKCLERSVPQCASNSAEVLKNTDELNIHEQYRSLHSQLAEVMARLDKLSVHSTQNDYNEACSFVEE